MAPISPLAVPPPADPDYPETDGKPIGETDFHITAILTLVQLLRDFFAAEEQVYVGGDMMFYYEQGNPKAVRAPDVFVVKGVGKHKRRVYKLWEELAAGRPAVPCTIFEITSKESRVEDLKVKYTLYERLGVQEYFLFDPLMEYLSPPLQGFVLMGGRYQPLSLAPDNILTSQAMGLRLRSEGDLLRIIDATTGQVIPTSSEALELARQEQQRAQSEAQRAEAEAQRAEAAEAKVAQLQAELERLRDG
jgi:Uma2 family endonuclease